VHPRNRETDRAGGLLDHSRVTLVKGQDQSRAAIEACEVAVAQIKAKEVAVGFVVRRPPTRGSWRKRLPHSFRMPPPVLNGRAGNPRHPGDRIVGQAFLG